MLALTKTSFLLNLWDLVLIAFLLYYYWKYNTSSDYPQSSTISSKGLLLGLFVFALTSWINPDYFHYMTFVKLADVDWAFSDKNVGEYAYQVICSATNGNYFLFRSIVWGSSILFIYLTTKRLEFDTHHSLFCILIMFPIVFSYGRATLAMSIYFYAVSFLCSSESKYKLSTLLITAILLYFSTFFHRSIIILLVITPIVFFLGRKWVISDLTLLFYILAIIIGVISFSDILYQSGTIEDKVLASKLSRYSQKEFEAANIFGKISDMMKYATFYVTTFILTYAIANNTDVPAKTQKLFSICLAIVLVSTGLYFSGSKNFTLFYRTLNMAFIPLSLLTAQMHREEILSHKQFMAIILVCLLNTSFVFIYGCYRYL